MNNSLKKVFTGVVGASIICLGLSENYSFDISAGQAETIDQDFPGYEQAFFDEYPKGTLEEGHPMHIEGLNFQAGRRLTASLAFYHNVTQSVSSDEVNCTYSTSQWRFPFIRTNSDYDTRVDCTPK